MASKAMLVWILALRILAFAALTASVVVLATNQFGVGVSKVTFTDVVTYRYVFAAAIVGAFYCLCQIPFAIYHAIKEERLTRIDCAPEFVFYGDKIMSWVLGAAAGAGFAATYEMKKVLEQLTDFFGSDDDTPKRFKFFDIGYIAAGLLLVGFVFVAVLSILTSITRSTSGKAKGRGFFAG